MSEKNIKQGIRTLRRRLWETAYLFMAVMLQAEMMAVNAAGGGADAITSSMQSFYSIVAALVSGVGSIILLWGVFEWGTAMQSNDGTMQANAFKRIGGGLVMILAPQIIIGFV